MSVAVEPIVQRREPRFRACGTRPLVVRLEWEENGKTKSIAGKIVDLSRSGMKISTNHSIDDGTPITVKIRASKVAIEVETVGQVCWSRMLPNECRHVGCLFATQLSDYVLDQLAATGYLERRTDTRQPIEFAVNIRKELDGDDRAAGTIFDYSPGGCRIVSPSFLGTDGRLLIEIARKGGGVSCFSVQPLWQQLIEDEYHTGCEFMNRPAYETLLQIIETEYTVAEDEPEKSIDLRPCFWLALVVVVVASSIRGWLF